MEYSGATYRVLDRGEPRHFADDHDRLGFVEIFGEAWPKAQWQVHADCLMSRLFEVPRNRFATRELELEPLHLGASGGKRFSRLFFLTNALRVEARTDVRHYLDKTVQPGYAT